MAMSLLKAKLIAFEEAKRDVAMAQLYGAKGEIAWGSQIRSYILNPYQMVKDHRTAHEVGNVQGVLDGAIDPFIEAYLPHSWTSPGGRPSQLPVPQLDPPHTLRYAPPSPGLVTQTRDHTSHSLRSLWSCP